MVLSCLPHTLEMQGLGASKLFKFFLLNSDDTSKRNPSKRNSTTSVEPETNASADAASPEDTANATDTRVRSLYTRVLGKTFF